MAYFDCLDFTCDFGFFCNTFVAGNVGNELKLMY